MNKIIEFRNLKLDDAHSLLEIYSDSEAMKFRGSKIMTSIDDAIAFVENQNMIEGEILTNRKAVVSRKDNLIIGSSMIRKESNSNEYEIGYSIGRNYWGQGFGNEIVKLLVDYIDKKNDVSSIVAWSHIDNVASLKILEKNGFRKNMDRSLENIWLLRRFK